MKSGNHSAESAGQVCEHFPPWGENDGGAAVHTVAFRFSNLAGRLKRSTPFGVLPLIISGLLNSAFSAVVDIGIQLALALANGNGSQCITNTVQGSNKHFDGTVDCQDQGVGNQSLLAGEANAGQNGEQNHSTCAGSSGGTHGGNQGKDHNDNQLEHGNIIAAAACDKQSSDHLHNGSAIHVDGHTQRQDKGSDLTVNTQFLGGGIQIQGQCCGTGGGGEAEHDHLEDLLDEDVGVQLADQADVEGIANKEISQQNRHCQHAVSQSRLKIINAVSGKSPAQQHKDGNRTKLCHSEAQEGNHDLADLFAEAVDHAFLAQAQLVHAETDHHGDENHAQNGVVDTQRCADVAGDDVQDHQQGVGSGGAGACGHTLNVNIEQAGLIEDQCDDTGDHQCNGAGHHKPADGFGGNTAQGGCLADLTDGHDHRAEHHRDDDQLQSPDEQLAADIKQAHSAFRTLCGNILEQDIVDHTPGCALCAQILSERHEKQAYKNTGHHSNQHLNGKFVVIIYLIPFLFPFYHLFFFKLLHYITNLSFPQVQFYILRYAAHTGLLFLELQLWPDDKKEAHQTVCFFFELNSLI